MAVAAAAAAGRHTPATLQAQAQPAGRDLGRAPQPAQARPRNRGGLGNSAAPAQRGYVGGPRMLVTVGPGGVVRRTPPTSGDSEGGLDDKAAALAHVCPAFCSVRGRTLYARACEYARAEQWDVARRVFAKAVAECPAYLTPWVSWAQMEKRCIPRGDDRRWAACREVLSNGLRVNPDAPPLLQAWGLLEMQRGNRIAALLLLDRSARLEPRNRPVLRWAPVIEARRELNASRFARLRAARSGGSAAEQS